MELAYNYAHLANIVSIVDFALNIYNAFSATLNVFHACSAAL